MTIVARSIRFPRAALPVVVLSCVVSLPGAAIAEQTSASESLSPEQHEELLAERDDLWREGRRLEAHGSFAEAITSAERMLALERRLLGSDHKDVLASLRWLSRLYVCSEEFAKARVRASQALELCTKVFGPDHWITTDTRLALEQVNASATRTPQQREELSHAAQMYKQVVLLQYQGKYAQAVSIAGQALEIRRNILGENHLDYASALNDLGFLYQSMGDYASAEPRYRRALEITGTTLGTEHPSYATSLNHLGSLCESEGDYTRAERLFRQAKNITGRALGQEHADYATSLNNLGGLYESLGDYARAERLYLQALKITGTALGEEDPDFAASLHNLGGLYHSMGDYTRAEPLYLRALKITGTALGNEHQSYATGLNNLGGLYKSMGDYARAESRYRRALAIFEKAFGKEHPSYATSLNNLGLLYQDMGDCARAERHFLDALQVFAKVCDKKHPSYATTLNNLATLYESMGDYARAGPFYRQSLDIFENAFGQEHASYATGLNNLGALDESMGDYTSAEQRFRRALEITGKVLGQEHPSYATSLNNLGGLYESMGDYASAEPFYHQALEIAGKALGEQHPVFAVSLNSLGRLYDATADYERAESFYRRALKLTRRHLTLTSAVQSERQQLAMAQMLRGRLDSYLSLCLRARRFSESAYREVLAWKGTVLNRQRQAKALADEPRLAPTFRELQRTAARLAHLMLVTPDPMGAESWRRQVAELLTEKERLEQKLSVASASYCQATKEVTLEDLRLALPAKSVLIDFLEYEHWTPPKEGEKGGFRSERRLVAFIISHEQAELEPINLGPVAPLSRAIDQWRETFGMSPPGKRAGNLLRKRVWEPLVSRVKQAEFILVSPDGVLGRLPLAALPGKEAGKYLLEEHAIALLPVPQALPALLKGLDRKEVQANLLLLGGVNYDGKPGQPTKAKQKKFGRAVRWTDQEKFDELEETEGEVATIRSIYEHHWGQQGMAVLKRSEATEEALRANAPRHRYIHLATHAFFAPPELRSTLAMAVDDHQTGFLRSDLSRFRVRGYDPGLLSGLALAGANDPTAATEDGDDGILTAEEVATLDLRGVDLVVLSACETGLGEVAGGEGLLGLQRAFQVAGARTTVASLWKVGDVAHAPFDGGVLPQSLGQRHEHAPSPARRTALDAQQKQNPGSGASRHGAIVGHPHLPPRLGRLRSLRRLALAQNGQYPGQQQQLGRH